MENEHRNEGLSIVGGIRCFLWIILMHVLGVIFFRLVGSVMGWVGLAALRTHMWIVEEFAVKVFVLWRLSVKRGLDLSMDAQGALHLFLPALLLVLGTRLLFDNTLALFLLRIEPARWLDEAVGEMLELPLPVVFLVFLTIPLVEEIIFRGFFLKRLLPRYGPATAIFFSALLFGVIHLNLHQAVNAFVLGIVFGIIYYKTGSLLLCIGAHLANNLFVPFVSVIIPDYLTTASVVQLAAGACTLLLGVWLLKKRMIEPGGITA
ncbi:MAG TPA: CPBP family intramembrane metalloprotease [Firmicutes bacterium]|nr:CPBP family intramembrane metalloprotease [Bacillota bacterium]